MNMFNEQTIFEEIMSEATVASPMDESSGTGNLTALPISIEIQLQLYDILVPILGFSIILLNLAVVISSGLILQTSNLLFNLNN